MSRAFIFLMSFFTLQAAEDTPLYVEWQPYEIQLLREKHTFLLLSKQSSLHEWENKGNGIWFACASDGSWYSCRSKKSKKYIHNFPDKIIARWYLVKKSRTYS